MPCHAKCGDLETNSEFILDLAQKDSRTWMILRWLVLHVSGETWSDTPKAVDLSQLRVECTKRELTLELLVQSAAFPWFCQVEVKLQHYLLSKRLNGRQREAQAVKGVVVFTLLSEPHPKVTLPSIGTRKTKVEPDAAVGMPAKPFVSQYGCLAHCCRTVAVLMQQLT